MDPTEMDMQSAAMVGGENHLFTADALEVVQLKFVDTMGAINSSQGYSVEYAHHHFGESGLDVTVSYSESTLFIHPTIRYEEKAAADSHIVPDDIVHKLRDALPSGQLDALIADPAEFEKKLEEQKGFTPPGELVHEFKFNGESENAEKLNMRLYKVTKMDEETNKYIERAQTLALWYIEQAEYTENFDSSNPTKEGFFHYLIFESASKGRLKFAGYATCYKFYCYDRVNSDLERVRISHFLLSPVYRQCGNGGKFLNAIYKDLKHDSSVYDITAETPAEPFIFMRDYADCTNLSQLPEFSKQNLRKGYNKEMERVARKKFKTNKFQVRRVYEMLKMNLEGPNSDSFKSELLTRLAGTMFRSQRDWNKISKALPETDLNLIRVNHCDDTQKQQLETQFQNCVEGYKIVLDRLHKYEASFRPGTAN